MTTEISRLRWACRRGMLELDVLLGVFLEEAFLKLPKEQQELFVQLLSCNDQELFEWLTGKKEPDPEFKTMVEQVRTHAKHRH